MTKKKNPPFGGSDDPEVAVGDSDQTIAPRRCLGKLDRILILFASGFRLHRFKAERLGDHCLHTSVSDLQKRHGIHFDRVTVTVPNRFGGETRVTEYWLSGYNLTKAQAIARALQGQRKEAA